MESGASGSPAALEGTWSPGWVIRAGRFNSDNLTDLLLYNPVTYFVFGVLLTLPEPATFLYRRWIAAAILIVFSPVFAPVGESAYGFVARHRYRLSRVCPLPSNEKIA